MSADSHLPYASASTVGSDQLVQVRRIGLGVDHDRPDGYSGRLLSRSRRPTSTSGRSTGRKAQVIQDLFCRLGIFDEGDQLHGALAARAGHDVQAPCSGHQLRPLQPPRAPGIVGALGDAQARQAMILAEMGAGADEQLADILGGAPDGRRQIDYRCFHDTEPLARS